MSYRDDVPPEFRRRNPPTTFTGNDLLNMEFPPITWGVPGILPSGVTLFGGREKMGKSWLAFSLCIAVATGGYMLGKMPVEQGGALYLSLEDPDRRLHKRLKRLVKDSPDLSRLHYATEWPTADRGGVEDLDAWLEEHEETRVVAIDTLKRIRPRTDTKRNPYETDYEAVQPFAALAAKHNVCIVILHHLNQQAEPHDPFDAFSGSSGLTAAMETAWLLTRKRGDADAFLMVDGKDIEEPQEMALGWDPATCTWTSKGDAEEYRLIGERREIVRVLKEAYPDPLGAKDVAIAVGRGDPKGYNATRQRLYQMSQTGEVKTAGRGLYTLPNNPNNPNNRDSAVRAVRDVREGSAAEDAARGPSNIDNTVYTSTNSSAVNDVNDVNTPPNGQRLRGEVRVVNVTKSEPYDVYIGRANSEFGLTDSDWHNPFKMPRDGTREEVIEKFERYLTEDRPDLMDRLPELEGKTLACWCKPDACHGDVLVRLLREAGKGVA